MDTVLSENVKVPNSLLVSGVIGSDVDNEVFDYLGQYGKIERVIKVTSSEAKFQHTAIVEYSSGGAIEYLKNVLPVDRPSSNQNIVHHIQLLSELYTVDRGSTLTQTYLSELRDVARLSGADFERILLDELARIQESTKPKTTEPDASGINQESQHASPVLIADATPINIGDSQTHSHECGSPPLEVGAAVLSPPRNPTQYLPSEHLSTPEIQKLVVEHVIKNSDLPLHYHGNTRLRPFSGRIPCPSSESDYDMWRSNVEFLLADPAMSATHTTRKMVESLFPPAATIVKHLGPNASPHEYLALLDSAYGIIDDGDELFAKFLNTNQDSGEKPSGYLQRLQTILSKVIKRGGLSASDSDRQLLKQFCRSCWNNSLLTSLQLEQKKNNPPLFSELLLWVRSEEDRQAAKSSRMKQHFGANRTKVQSNTLSVEDYATEDDVVTAAPYDPQKLEKQMAKLQAQIASLKASLSSSQASAKPGEKQKAKLKAPAEENPSLSPEPKLTNKKPRPWYCFRCGEDGHIAPSCNHEANPELVEKKRRELKQKQESWETKFKLNAVPVEGLPGTGAENHSPNPKPMTKASIRSHKVEPQAKLPRGLVGQKCIADVSVSGVNTMCLLDSGSQVTTVTASFSKSYLSEHPIQPFQALDVEGANGQNVPYLGYIPITLKFPKEFVDAEPEISTLALVVPDRHSNCDLPVLIGTNALDILYEEHCIDKNPNDLSPVYGYRQILRVLKLRNKVNSTGRIGLATLRGKEQQVLPAQARVCLEGHVKVDIPGDCAIVEQPQSSALPGGVFVECCLVTLPRHRPHKLAVWMRNENEHDVTLPSNCVIAELHTPKEIYDNLPDSDKPVDTVRCCAGIPKPAKGPDQSGFTFDFGDSPLSKEWKDRVTCSLYEYRDVFAYNETDFGRATKVKHHINLKDDAPFKQRSRPIHPNDYEAVRKHLRTLLDAGVIRESESPYASPIVVVRKKNGEVRLCIDYRKLNSLTIRDAYALPNLEEAFSVLAGSRWFSVMDLKSGYYQIEMEERDKPKTAFVCPLGFYEFNRMPQGITNAPSTFQRLMERVMGSINLKEVLVFMDDIIVFSSTLEEHKTRLKHVLQQLRENGLKLSPKKCHFFQSSVRYLGHIVSSRGVETDPDKVSALRTWPRPQTLGELKSFLGFAGYYRRYVRDYSKIVKPLNDLTGGYPPYRKGQKTSSPGGYFNPKEPFNERWTPECQKAFDMIIEKLTSAPVLGFADPKLPYVLHTDASTSGLGAALYQEQDGEMRVIAYASRGLSSSEKRYPAHKLEFLALKWSIVEKLHDYLYGNAFTVVTDNNPLTYVLKSAKLDAASYRWLAALSTFDFNIKYRAGKSNQDADGLSRRPHDSMADDHASLEEEERIKRFTSHHLSSSCNQQDLPVDAVAVLCQHRLLTEADDNLPSITLVESLAIHPDAVPDAYENDDVLGCSTIPTYSPEELQEHQRSDPIIGQVVQVLEGGDEANLIPDSLELKLMLMGRKRLEMRNGLLYRTRQSGDDVTYQFVAPKSLRAAILKSLHEDMGHMGLERTLDLVRSRFYWPKMATDVEKKIKSCGRCVRRKTQPERSAPLVNIHTTRPMELVCIDYLSLEPDNHNTKDILVITDHFTKYAVAIPTKDQKATTVAKALWEQFFVHYGFPERLLSDQGRDFESQLIKELCALAGITKARTTPYHPRGNPVERFNRTLLGMLGTLKNKEKSHWRDYVKPLTHAYNCTKNDVTGFSPYQLMFGRQPRLPVDIAFCLPVKDGSPKSHSQYVKHLKARLEESYQIATRNSQKVADRNKRRFDKAVRESTLEEGDQVLVKNLRFRGKHKLADKWESTMYKVLEKMGDLPVYKVQSINGDGPIRTLHRDLLLPCGDLSEAEETEPVKPKVRKPRTRQSHPQLLEELSESEDDLLIYPAQSSVPPEQRFTQVCEIPRTQKTNANPEDGGLPAMPSGPLTSQPQGGPDDSNPPAEPVETPPELVEGEEPEIIVEQPSAGEDSTQMDVTNENEPDMTNKTDMANENEPDMTNETDEEENPARGGTVGVLQDAEPKHTQASETSDRQTESETVTDGNTNDSTRRSERSRQPPDRFHYIQMGKPLMSFAQSILQSFNQALDTMSNYDNPHMNQRPAHEGTHADSRGESVTHMGTKPIYVI